ncbi:recombinase family protein [Kitasatospora sp. NPDC086791]|uniref:recombinase family protein n=1 Tax=Kitasatospora sp. NPDC086791 TaxID=3155178 RepID=UPI00342D0B32
MANKSTLAQSATAVVAHVTSVRVLRAVDYLRVSTDQQRKGYGIASQGRKTVALMARKNWAHVGTYEDECISGSLEAAERPDLNRLMADAASMPRPFDVVVVPEGRAIGRTGRAFWRWVWALEDIGIFVAIVDGDIDNTTDAGRGEMRRQADYAETEYERIRSRTQGGIQEKAEDGGLTGGRPRYGYRIADKGQKGLSRIVIDKCDDGEGCAKVHEFVVLRRAWELVVLDRCNARQAALRLNAEGLLTRRGLLWSNRNLWSRLMDATGEPEMAFRHHGRAKPGPDGNPIFGNTVIIPLEPIFTPDEREQLRRAMVRNRRGDGTKSAAAHYPLSTRIFGLCGRHYGGLNRKERGGRAYHCSGKREKYAGASVCDCPTINADVLEKIVWAETSKLLGEPERLQAMSEDWLSTAMGNQVNYDERAADLDRQIDEQDSVLSVTMVVAAKQAARRGLSGEAAEEAVQRTVKPTADELAESIALRDEVLAWKAENEAAGQRAADLRELAKVARSRLRKMTSVEQEEVLDLLNVRVTITGKPPRGRRDDCTLAKGFADRGRGVPVLTDEAWQVIEPVLAAVGRRKRANEIPIRQAVEAFLYKARTGVPWSKLPPKFGAPTSLQTRYHRWYTLGVWQQVMDLLADCESEPQPMELYPLPPMEVTGAVDPRLFVGVGSAPHDIIPTGNGMSASDG